MAKRHLAAGAYMIMIESEGITEDVRRHKKSIEDFPYLLGFTAFSWTQSSRAFLPAIW